MERHHGVAKIIVEPLIRFQEDILNDVAGINPPRQDRVETQIDDPPQGFAKFRQELIEAPASPVFARSSNS